LAIACVLFDLDGVIRHWDPADTDAIEERHGLERGSILATAFGPELGPSVVTGQLDYEAWAALVGERLGCPEAVAEWGQGRGHVDHDAVAVVDDVRGAGLTVALLSNATTRLEDDLDVLGLATHFHHVFNTARLGVCKPDPAVYQRVLGDLGLPGEQVVFTDDTPGWAEAAAQVGMRGVHFSGVGALRDELRRLGVALPSRSPGTT